MRRFPIEQVLLASMPLWTGVPAHAQTSSTVTLSDFRILVTDLAPSDGVSPSLALVPGALSSVGVTLSNTPTSWSQQGDAAFGAVSTSGGLGDTGGAASFAGDPFGDGEVIAASAFSGPSRADSEGTAYVVGPPGALAEFVLGPQAQVTFTGTASIDWNADNAQASTYGLVDLSFWQIVGDTETAAGRSDAWGGYMGTGEGALSGSTSSPFELSFANDSDTQDLVGYQFGVSASATGFEGIPTPVDEPGRAGLLLLGGLVLARVARTRR